MWRQCFPWNWKYLLSLDISQNYVLWRLEELKSHSFSLRIPEYISCNFLFEIYVTNYAICSSFILDMNCSCKNPIFHANPHVYYLIFSRVSHSISKIDSISLGVTTYRSTAEIKPKARRRLLVLNNIKTKAQVGRR